MPYSLKKASNASACLRACSRPVVSLRQRGQSSAMVPSGRRSTRMSRPSFSSQHAQAPCWAASWASIWSPVTPPRGPSRLRPLLKLLRRYSASFHVIAPCCFKHARAVASPRGGGVRLGRVCWIGSRRSRCSSGAARRIVPPCAHRWSMARALPWVTRFRCDASASVGGPRATTAFGRTSRACRIHT